MILGIRYIIAWLLICGFSVAYGQIAGDVTGDEIIDATDYIELQNIIAGKQKHTFVSDINKDGETNVADLLILENYIYREGVEPKHGTQKAVKTQVHISPGLVNSSNKTIEIILKNGNPIAGFQMEFAGIENIVSIDGGLLKTSGMKYQFHENMLYATLDKGAQIQPGNNILFTLTYQGDFDEICIVRPVFVNVLAELFTVSVGQCANSLFTVEGLNELKDVVINQKKPGKYSDVNKDGYVNVSDVLIVENFLLRNGPTPPGIIEETKGKVKLELTQVNNTERTLEVELMNKKSISSFQLTIEGISGIDLYGGVVVDNDLDVVVDNNKIIAFLGNGSPIPPGRNSLVKLSYKDTTAGEVCLYNPVFVNTTANGFGIELGECKSLVPIILGCTDSLALNYNDLANKDDGTCEYPPPPPKPPKEPKVKPEKAQKESNETALVKEEKEKREKSPKPEKQKKEKKQKVNEERPEKSGKAKKEKQKTEKEKKKEEIVEESPKKELRHEQEIKLQTATNIEDIDKAVLVLKVTALERMNIPNPTKGMMVYDTDADAFIYYDGKVWRVVGSGDAQAFGFDVKRKGKKWFKSEKDKE